MIKLSFIDGKVMTFNDKDYMTIRKEFRIVGKLVGIPVSYPRNLQWNALPAVYSENEAKLLLDKNLVIIEDRKLLRNPPSEETKEIFNNHSKHLEENLRQSYIKTRLEPTKAVMNDVIAGKRKKLLKSGVPENEINVTEEDIIREKTEQLQQSFPTSTVTTQILNEYPFNSQLNFDEVKDIQVTDMRKYKIFRDLWEKNFVITNGDSFGCDFLVYPGDPVSFHASQIIHIVNLADKFNVKYLVSCGRLSISVNKKCVFAYVKENDEIGYQTLEWDNPKLREQLLLNHKSSSDKQ